MKPPAIRNSLSSDAKLVTETHHALVDLYTERKIDPLIHKTVPFDELPEALDLLQSRKTHGKLVTTPS